MGSTGSGRISDYPGSSPAAKPGGQGGGIGPSVEDRCARAFNARLEDVELSDYYRAHANLPPKGTRVELVKRKRLVVQTTDGEGIGNLPTSFNFLASCMNEGWTYIGTVQQVRSGPPVASISVDFAATPPQ